MMRAPLCLAAILCALAGTAPAQEFAHCYTGTPPEGALPSTQSPPPLGSLGANLSLAVVRAACGAPVDADRDFLAGIIAAAECSPSSEIAGFVSDYMARPPETLSAEVIRGMGINAAVFAPICTALAECAPGPGGYSPDCQAVLAGPGQ